MEEEGYKLAPERKHQQKEPSKRRQKLAGVRGKQEFNIEGVGGHIERARCRPRFREQWALP